MLHYIHDGSFEGLLTCIYESFYRHEKPEKILRQLAQQKNLFEKIVEIPTDKEKAMKVYNAIKEKISYSALKNAYFTYLSDLDSADYWVFEYLKLGWKIGRDLDLHLSDDRVLKVHQISRKVLMENHRMLGLIRFKQLSEHLYYAAIEPDFNVTALVAPHFAKRMADQHWIIHDVKRGLAAMYNKMEWVLTAMPSTEILSVGEKELDYQELWKEYFKSIAIPNRLNPKLQKQFMPQRYWKHLVEK